MTRPRPQQHLAEVVRIAGDADNDATAEVQAIIEKGLAAHREQEQQKRLAERGTLDKLNPHVSDAGACPRSVWYSLKNVPESNPPTADDIARFELGHMYEDFMARIFAAQDEGFVREQRVEIPVDGTKVTGRRDFDTGALVQNDKIIRELKSTNARSLGFLIKERRPRDSNVRQLNLYLHAEGVETGILTYFATGATKGEPFQRSWRITYDPKMAEADLDALAILNYAAKNGQTVDRPAGVTKGKYPCTTYCRYVNYCWSDK